MEACPRPSVLIVYYSFSQQTERVASVIAQRLEVRGADVATARIEFTDRRWSKRFESIPMRFPLLKIIGMLPAQVRQQTGEIRIPPDAVTGGYDLVVIGSPTWWFRVCVPIRSYLKAPAAQRAMAGTPFAGYSTSRRYWKRNVGDIKRLARRMAGAGSVGRTS